MGKTHRRNVVSRGGKDLPQQLTSGTALLAILIFVVCVAVIVVYWPALSARALSFDDGQYLTENVLVQNPSWTSVRRFLTEVLEPSTVGGYYQPLSMISLMTDCALGGRADNLEPFHRTSLALHVANTTLIIVLLYMLFGQAWIAAAVGLLFGIHPLTVEPIPWVGERKTLLAAFFALWSLIIYVRYTHKSSWRLYAGCLVAYVLAILSKPTTLPLPVLMLLMDYWPLNRFRWKAIVEKLPLFAVAGALAIITYISQSRTAFTDLPGKEYHPAYVPLILCHNIVFYLYKIIWPANLSSHYSFPVPLGLSNPVVLAAAIGTCVLIALLAASLRWTRGLLTGWLIFFVAILPTMGIVGFSDVIASDKFVYLPSAGLLMALAAFLGWVCSGGKTAVRRTALIVMLVVLAGAESVATRRYLAHWQDGVSLFRHMLGMTPDVATVNNMLGFSLQSQGKLDEAMGYYRRSVQIDPCEAGVYYNMGNVLRLQGKLDEASACYRRAITVDPDYAAAHNNLGIVLVSQGKLDEAISHYRQALKVKPDYIDIRFNLGNALQSQGKLDEAISHYRYALQIRLSDAAMHCKLADALKSQGRFDEAIIHYRKTLRINTNFAEAYNGLGNVLSEQGKSDEAVNYYRKAVQIDPNYAQAHNNLGIELGAQGELDEAISHFRRVLQIKPDYAEAYNNLGIALGEQGKFDEAMKSYRQALILKPDWPLPLNGIALILATHPDPKIRDAAQAIKLAQRAAELTKHQDARILNTLAAAYSAAGRFDQAIATAQKAIDLASAAGDHGLADYLRKQLELYKKAKP